VGASRPGFHRVTLAVVLGACTASAPPAALTPPPATEAGAVVSGTVWLTGRGETRIAGGAEVFPAPGAAMSEVSIIEHVGTRVAPAGGTLQRTTTLPFVPVGGAPHLLVVVEPMPGADAPSDGRALVRLVSWKTSFMRAGWELDYEALDCAPDWTADGLAASLACSLAVPTPDGSSPADAPAAELRAAWRVSTIQDDVGPALEVTYRLDGAYRAEGRSVAWLPAEPPVAGFWDLTLPDVRVGGTYLAPELLRIRLGAREGTLEGSALEVSLQEVYSDSPNLVGAAGWATLVEMSGGREWWTPALGDCTASVGRDGLVGSASCPGDPAFPERSTSLEVRWAPRP
jgi:hypothetical protein